MGDRAVLRVKRPRGVIAIPAALLGVVLVLGAVLWGRGDLNSLICDGGCGPAYVTAPRSLTANRVPDVAAIDALPPGSADPAKVEAAVSSALDASDLGSRTGFVALDPSSGDVLASRGSGAFVPASTNKLLTSFSALSLIDPQHRFTTRVAAEGAVSDGGTIILVGDGDPYLVTKRAKNHDRAIHADLTTLATRTATALKKADVSSVRLRFDASLFTGPSVSPTWPSSYISGNIVTPVSALWTDQGVQSNGVRSADPAASAARILAGLLAGHGITVTGDPSAKEAVETDPTVASVQSATVAQIVSTLIRTSDNQAAEVMLRHVAIATGRPATFNGGSDGVKSALTAARIDTSGLKLFDGSGLSRRNRVAPTTLAEILRAASERPRTSSLISDLPVSGFTGTLVKRFANLPGARGLVRAKTGTLTGVHSLAGYAVDAEGGPIIFALMADHTSKVASVTAEAALDRVAAALATCSCQK
jgi:D-alanyl-D-alanine carboxypeptidase/D-alanyl-D-alanine-endopeptidase (penicillin-binding protein 4)